MRNYIHIVILTWNHWPVTKRCLESVKRLQGPHCRVVLVDNASKDGTPDLVRRHFPEIHVIENEKNLGFAAGCNVGIRFAIDSGADYILLLNNDVIVESNLVSVLLKSAEVHPNAGILMPLIRQLDSSADVWFIGSKCSRLTLDPVEFGSARMYSIPTDLSREVDYIMGTAMFVRADVLECVGLFDESFFMYYEDMDLSLRVREAGYTLRYVPGSTVWHTVEASTDESPQLRHYYKARGSVRFFRKHVHGLHWLLILPYRVGSAVKRIILLWIRAQFPSLHAYCLGLWDGVRGKYSGEYV